MYPVPLALPLLLALRATAQGSGTDAHIEGTETSKFAITGAVIGGILLLLSLVAVAIYGIDRWLSRRRAREARFAPLPTNPLDGDVEAKPHEPYRYLATTKPVTPTTPRANVGYIVVQQPPRGPSRNAGSRTDWPSGTTTSSAASSSATLPCISAAPPPPPPLPSPGPSLMRTSYTPTLVGGLPPGAAPPSPGYPYTQAASPTTPRAQSQSQSQRR